MTVNQLINKQHVKVIKNHLKALTCEHVWRKYGSGFKCLNVCKYYTGLSVDLNELIEKEIALEKEK